MKTQLILIATFFVVSFAHSQTAEEYYKRGVHKSNYLEDYRGAIADLSKAIELNPKFTQAYFHRAGGKGKLEDYRGAIADLSKAIELNPKFALAYFFRGIAKINLRQKESGCLDLSKAGELGNERAYVLIKKHCN